jgi:ABC-type phosphate transport system substrate-binding protein
VTIGGSTSVYPFAQEAANWFDANNSNIVISVNQGGSGAGMAAVCSGQVNIGQASTFYGSGAQPAATPLALQTSYACPQTVSIQVVAYDGVDAIVPTLNVHGLQSVSWDTLQSIYVAGSATQSALTSNVFQVAAEQLNGKTTGVVQPALGVAYAWDQIPACAAATTNCAGSGFAGNALAAGVGGVITTDYAPCASPYGADLCAVAATGHATPCGFLVCAGGTGAGAGAGQYGATIHTWARSDVSGTTQSFISRVLAVGATGGTATGIGFSGCSGDNQFDGCGLTVSHTANGNPAVISGVAGDTDGLGYASDGLVQTAGSNVLPVNLQGYGQTVVVNIQGESTALKAIALGISDHENNNPAINTAQAYVGWRPFVNVETAKPTGEVLRYLQFVMDPANNEALAAATAEISVYASGLAGTVPIVGLS